MNSFQTQTLPAVLSYPRQVNLSKAEIFRYEPTPHAGCKYKRPWPVLTNQLRVKRIYQSSVYSERFSDIGPHI